MSLYYCVFVLLLVCCAALELPGLGQTNDEDSRPLSLEDYEVLDRLASHRVTYPPGFKFMYVDHAGHIVEDHKPAGSLTIVGSPQTVHSALYLAAQNVGKMLKYTTSTLFNSMVAKGATIGIFTLAETMLVYPQLAHLRDTPECHGRCDGTCSHTCTFDGRKWSAVYGVTSGGYSVTMQENLLCQHDPHHNRHSTLIHETGHLVMLTGMTSTETHNVQTAYAHAHASSIWTNSAYAMANYREYWAEATATFFNMELESNNAGMNICGHSACNSEIAVRQNLHTKDVQLYNVLVEVYVPGHATLTSGLSICPSSG